MDGVPKSLEKVLKNAGLITKWEARGKQKGRKEIINLLKSGKSPDEIIKEYGEANEK